MLVEGAREAAVAYGVTGVPESYLVAPSGVVVWKQLGGVTGRRHRRCDRSTHGGFCGAMSRRAVSWTAAVVVAVAAFLYGAVAEAPPSTNADRVRDLAEDFACPVCAGQSVGESDVPVAREIRRQIAVWVDEGRSDAYIRDQLVAAYDADIDYNPSGSGFTSLVWILPLIAGAGIATVVVVMLRPGRAAASGSGELPAAGRRRRGRNAAVWTVAIVVVAGAAGLLVARSSGSRTSDGSITGEIPLHCPGEDLRGPAAALRRRPVRRHRRLRRSPGDPALQCGGSHLPGMAHVPPGGPGCCRAIPRRRGGGGSRLPRRPAVPGHCGPRGGRRRERGPGSGRLRLVGPAPPTRSSCWPSPG